MTPDERMKIFSLVADYEDAKGGRPAIEVLYKITEYIEKLEHNAYNRGIDARHGNDG